MCHKDLKHVHPAVAKAVASALQVDEEWRKLKRCEERLKKARERLHALYRKSDDQYQAASALGLDWAVCEIREALQRGQSVSEYLADLHRNFPTEYAELVT